MAHEALVSTTQSFTPRVHVHLYTKDSCRWMRATSSLGYNYWKMTSKSHTNCDSDRLLALALTNLAPESSTTAGSQSALSNYASLMPENSAAVSHCCPCRYCSHRRWVDASITTVWPHLQAIDRMRCCNTYSRECSLSGQTCSHQADQTLIHRSCLEIAASNVLTPFVVLAHLRCVF